MSGLDIEDLWELSKNHDKFTEYAAARLQGKLFQGKPVEPIFDTYLDEIPEDFLEYACELDEEGLFKERLGKVVEELLLDKFKNHNAEDSDNREYVSRLIYLAEILDLKSVFYIIYEFVKCTEYMGLSGAHTSDIYTQFLGALAQFQRSRDLVYFWFDRFYDDNYIRYAQPLFTGLRRSSFENAAIALPRLFALAAQYPKYLDKNRALRPLVKSCEHGKAAQQVGAGFACLSADEQKQVMDSIWSLDSDLRQPLFTALVLGILESQRKAAIIKQICPPSQYIHTPSPVTSIKPSDYIPGEEMICP